MKLLFVSILSIAVVLSACSPITPVASLSTPAIDTATHPPTSLQTPTATADLLREANIREKCPNILSSDNLSEIKAGGVVVLFKSRYLDDIRDAYLLNLANNQLFEFSHQGEILSYYGVAVSPDRKTLAYSVTTPKDESIKLVLSNSMGERQKIIPIKSDIPYPMYGNVGGWLSNQQLFLNRELFNPYTEEKKTFNPEEFPGISPDDQGVYSLQFDPELTRVIYPHSHATTAMAELPTKQVLAEIPALSRGVPEITWSPDGNFVAIVGAQTHESIADEIFLVDRDGKETRQITHLSTHLSKYFDDTGYRLTNLSWSPDGKSIAFWQIAGSIDTRELRLFVLDTKTEELTSYCTWGKPKGITFYGPIWSPDGTQLLIGDFSIQDKVRAVIVDIDTNVAVPISENFIPVGWMVAP